MILKVILIALCLLTSACGTSDNIVIETEVETIKEEESIYIDPIQDVFLIDELNETVKQRWQEACGGKAVDNYQLEMMYQPIYEKEVKDIDGQSIFLSDYEHLAMQFVSVDCSHCKSEIQDYLISLLNEKEDVQFVQVFTQGDKESILNLYDSLSVAIPDNLIILVEDQGLNQYRKDTLAIEISPTTIFYNNGVVSFDIVGLLDLSKYQKAYEIAYENPIKKEELVNKEGISIFELSRDQEDVKNSLSKENQEKIEALDEAIYHYTRNLTYTMMGNTCDFATMLQGSDQYISEIDDFSYYKDKELVLFYVSLSQGDSEKIEFINSLLEDKSKEYIVILIEGFTSSSKIYEEMNVSFDCPVVSILGYMPKDFYHYPIQDYPSAIFIEKGTFIGAYSVIESKEKFEFALNTFLGEDCIGLKANN